MEGLRLGPYRIDRELVAGGMGKVSAATLAEQTPGLSTGMRISSRAPR